MQLQKNQASYCHLCVKELKPNSIADSQTEP